MDLNRIKELVESVLPKEQRSTQYTLSEIQEGLELAGYALPERTLYRQLKGLGVQKNAGGRYGDPEMVLLLGWNQRRERYSSYAEFFRVEGSHLYDIAKIRLAA